MGVTETIELGNTDFAIRKGKLQIRLEWVFRFILLLLVALTNLGLWFNQRLLTRHEFQSTVNDVNKRLEDHESRLRALERQP